MEKIPVETTRDDNFRFHFKYWLFVVRFFPVAQSIVVLFFVRDITLLSKSKRKYVEFGLLVQEILAITFSKIQNITPAEATVSCSFAVYSKTNSPTVGNPFSPDSV